MKKLNSKWDALKNSWYVWLFPLFAVGLSLWLARAYYERQGPMIRISFEDGAGLQAEKTQVRHRGVPIGIVKKLYLSDDNQEVIAEVTLQKSAAKFAVEGSKFWTVLPKADLQGVSGLDTIFQGSYIAAIPGPPSDERKTEFKEQIGSLVSSHLEGTSSYLLETDSVESINEYDSITFRGLKVGEVTKMFLAKGSQSIHLQINVENRYAKIIRDNTVFWRKSAVQAKLGLFSSEVKINSLDTILHGGIELSTPEPAGPEAKARTKFTLMANAPKNYEKWNPKLDDAN